MLKSGKSRLSDFDRLWLELDDMIASRRRTMWMYAIGLLGVVVTIGILAAMVIGPEDGFGLCFMLTMFASIFGLIGFFVARTRLQKMSRKVDFAKEVIEAFADDFHPARKIHWYLDLRHYDVEDKKYWSGRSMHGNAKYRYLDRWWRQKFFLIDGTRVVVERKADVKVRKGAIQRDKRRVYLKVYPSEKAFGPGPFQGDADLDSMVREAIRGSFHDPPEVIRVRREGPQPYIGIAVTQLDAPILGTEVVALVEAVLLYLRLKG